MVPRAPLQATTNVPITPRSQRSSLPRFLIESKSEKNLETDWAIQRCRFLTGGFFENALTPPGPELRHSVRERSSLWLCYAWPKQNLLTR